MGTLSLHSITIYHVHYTFGVQRYSERGKWCLDMAYCTPFMLHRCTLTYIPWCSFANVLNRSSSIFPIAPRSIFQVGWPYFSVLYFLKIHNFSASLKQESSLFGYFSLIVSLVPIGRWRKRQSSSQWGARLLHSQVTSLQSSSSVRNAQCYRINIQAIYLPRVESSTVERIFSIVSVCQIMNKNINWWVSITIAPSPFSVWPLCYDCV